MPLENFSDNTRVHTPKGSRGSFFCISFIENDLYLYRYNVPGRYDLYSFKLLSSDRGITFSSDTNTSMRQALKMLDDDMSKDNVRKLLIKAAHNPNTCGRMLRLHDSMLRVLTPKPFLKKLEKEITTGITERALIRQKLASLRDVI